MVRKFWNQNRNLMTKRSRSITARRNSVVLFANFISIAEQKLEPLDSRLITQW